MKDLGEKFGQLDFYFLLSRVSFLLQLHICCNIFPFRAHFPRHHVKLEMHRRLESRRHQKQSVMLSYTTTTLCTVMQDHLRKDCCRRRWGRGKQQLFLAILCHSTCTTLLAMIKCMFIERQRLFSKLENLPGDALIKQEV